MRIEVADSPEALAGLAAGRLVGWIRDDLEAFGRSIVALSGGRSPVGMLQRLAAVDLPWEQIHIVQVDERVAPDGHPDRNWTMLREALLDRIRIPAANLHPMPVTATDLERAAADYALLLRELAGAPPTLDIVHLGLGPDGHTASLVPGDPAAAADSDVTVTNPYEGWRRMTLTFPAINRARRIVWLVQGTARARAVEAMLTGGEVPAARVRREFTDLLLDPDAAQGVPERGPATS